MSKSEREKFEAAAKTYAAPEGHFEGLEPWKVCRFFLLTGCHPDVIVHPAEYNLRIDGDAVAWRRPKNKVPMRVRIPDADLTWLPTFLLEQTGRSEDTYLRLVTRIGETAGIGGVTSPRTLRHTFLQWVAEEYHGDVNRLMRLGGCSLRVAMRYVREYESMSDDRLKNR